MQTQHTTNLNGVNKAKDLAAEAHLTRTPQSAQETLVTDESLKGSHCSVSSLSTPLFSHLVQPTDSISTVVAAQGDDQSPDPG